MASTNSLDPLVVQTNLDSVFFQTLEYKMVPGLATFKTGDIFKQQSVTNAAFIEAVHSGGGGFWQRKGEEASVPVTTSRTTNRVVYTPETFAISEQFSKEWFMDEMHSTYQNVVRRMATNANATRDREAFGLYNNGFSTTLTADGVSVFNASHPLIDGGTQSNTFSGAGSALSVTALDSAIVAMTTMKAQDGVIASCVPKAILVHPSKYTLALQLVGSVLFPDGTATNALNAYASTYGIKVYQSPYLESTTAWFLLADNHSFTRFYRTEVEMTLVDWRIAGNNNFVYKGDFRETYGVTDYIGSVGNVGV